jgi:hypothetical protein
MTPFRLTTLALVAAVVAASHVGASRAASFTWHTTTASDSADTGAVGNELCFGAGSPGQATCGGGGAVPAGDIGVQAYEVHGGLSGAVQASFLGNFDSNGVGVSDTVEMSSGHSAGNPNNAVSNEYLDAGGKTVTDFVIIQLPGNGYVPTSISETAWGNLHNNADIWIGGSTAAYANLAAFTAAFSRSSSPLTLATLDASFVHKTYVNPSPTSSTPTIDLSALYGGSQTGAYMIIAADLNDSGTASPDYFKIAGLSASSPVTKVPEPGTLAILALGLVGLAVAKRRRGRRPDAAAT